MKRWLLLVISLLSLDLSVGAKDEIKRYDDESRPVFAKKGTWSVGGTASVSGHSNSNYSFFVVEGINSNGFKLSVTPEFCWFLADNIAVGGKLGYSYNFLDAETGSVKVSTISLGVDNFYTARQTLNMMAYARFFIPIGDAKRISFYADAGLQGSYSRAKESEQHTGSVVGTYQDRWKLGIFVNPGIMAYVLDNRIAVFASLGIAGFGFSQTNQVHNQVSEGTRRSFTFNFLINPTVLSVGVNFFIDKKK